MNICGIANLSSQIVKKLQNDISDIDGDYKATIYRNAIFN